ncbi:MAG TPA: thioredoxin domain-containing protein [Polyangiaceae bacterium]|nr:thioredoxin domain-containing protein [Polyangiaceae bacterium]
MAAENRLARETSPYLLQHAHNPVDWYPWGPEALERARREERPILLSIGYAACHWCHVMERESFENAAIAAQMNENFVCIKVDREERPDLDDIYMSATVAMSGSGGWPMTVFLTPEQEPFFAGTYFPPVDRFGRSGFGTLLTKLSELWKNERQAVFEQAKQLTDHVRQQSGPGASPGALALDSQRLAVQQLAQSYDPRHGGFGKAPKFPPAQSLELFLRYARRTGDAQALTMLRGTLDGMKSGGMYDQLGGGFARYSTDERWHVPHFEKMLYDNAQLAKVYTEAHQLTGDAEYARVACETLDYILREMQSPEGGYYSATDADSEGVEGQYFVWEPYEVEELLPAEDAADFCAYYDVTPEGNWEGRSVLRVQRPHQVVAEELGISETELRASLARAIPVLYEARSKRVPPLLDDKVLVAWNGLMIDALASAARVFPERGYAESAARAASFLLERLARADGGLYRTYRAGKSHLSAYLEDYAYFVQGLVSLYEVSGDERFLNEAGRLAERMIRDFGDAEGGPFYQTAHDHEALIARVRDGHDGALPNPNAIAAHALARLARHLGRPEWEERARQALRGYAQSLERLPRAFGSTLNALDFISEASLELVVVGEPGVAGYDDLVAEIAKRYSPNRIEARLAPSQASSLPLTQGKTQVDGQAALYVCRNYACAAPVTSATEAEALLSAAGERQASI